MNCYERYAKYADRGDFQYEVVEDSDTGGVLIEECEYKGRSRATITNCGSEFEVSIDLDNDPFLIETTRSNRKRAREFAEMVIKNDEENNSKNLKYI